MTSASVVHVDVFSDITCPWCWVGKRSIEVAAQELNAKNPVITLALHWKAFLLYPDVPPTGVDKMNYWNNMWGKGWEHGFWADTVNRGKTLGIHLHLPKGAMISNTENCHKVLAFYEDDWKKQGMVKEAFLRACQEFGKNLSSEQDIVAVLSEVGISADEIHKALTDPVAEKRFRDELLAGRRLGVRGVPRFHFPNGEVISGCTSVAGFKQALQACL